MNILQTVKYYEPSKGGMESVVKSIVEGVSIMDATKHFTIYANSHFSSYKRTSLQIPQIKIIKETTPFLFKSQPLSFRYSNLRSLIEMSDVIHHHYPFPNMEMALLRNFEVLKNKKLIVTWHANIKNSRWSFIKKFYNPIIKTLLDRTDSIVVTSPQLLESSDILDEFREKVHVIPLSFDPSFEINVSKSRKFPLGRRKKVLFVGKLRVYKGIAHLIDAVKELDVDLIIVGDGETESALKKQVHDLNIYDRVTFLKKVSDQQLIKIYEDADLFVLPSINEAEAFGVVQLEAMANGLPVINTKLQSGVPYVSLDRISGFTVEPKDSVALKEAIKNIFSDANRYELFSKNSLERAQLFSRRNMAKTYNNLYNS